MYAWLVGVVLVSGMAQMAPVVNAVLRSGLVREDLLIEYEKGNLACLEERTCDAALVWGQPRGEAALTYEWVLLGFDTISIVVGGGTASEITSGTLREVLTGKLKGWQVVGPAFDPHAIDVVNEMVGGRLKVDRRLDSAGEIVQAAAEARTIGLVAHSYLRAIPSKVSELRVTDMPKTADGIRSGSYPLARPAYAALRKKGADAAAFGEAVAGSTFRQILSRHEFVVGR